MTIYIHYGDVAVALLGEIFAHILHWHGVRLLWSSCRVRRHPAARTLYN